jgi:hypothetical protein
LASLIHDQEETMILIELLLELFGELILQVLLQVFIEIVFHVFIEPMKRVEAKFPSAPIAPYLFLGLVSGWLSLLFLPASLLKDPQLKVLNLIVTPAIVGLIMSGIGKQRQKKGQETLKIDHFVPGFVLALSFALVRFTLAK